MIERQDAVCISIKRSLWRRNALFWGSLLLAFGVLIFLYLGSQVPADLCVTQLFDAASGKPVALPLQRIPGRSEESVIVLQHHFRIDLAKTPRPAVYLGEAVPFYDLQVNGRNLTSRADLQKRDRRDLAPHLHALPMDALHAGENLLILRVPLANELSESRVGMLCIGDYDLLYGIYRANWWRRIGGLYLCLALFVVLAAVALGLRRLSPAAPVYLWYVGCLLLMACRTGYLVAGDMPGGPLAWRTVSDLSIVLLVFALYQLMASFWGIALRHWGLAWLVIAAVLQVSCLWSNWNLRLPNLNLAFWLSIAAVAAILMRHVIARIAHAPAVERRCMQWAMLFAVCCGALEAITYRLDPRLRLVWIYPPGTAALALMFVFLMLRRALLGSRLHGHATQMLRRDLDRAMAPASMQSAEVWKSLSSGLADRERQRMLHDIDDGFGSRMLAVMQQLKHEHPESRLNVDISRALLDLRLMIDAMEEGSALIDNAFNTLQLRLQGTLAAAGIHSHWEMTGVADMRVRNRRKLMELFRCLEELLSNVIQHSVASHVLISAHSNGGMLVVRIEDDGRGMSAGAIHGCGLRNVQTRMRMLGGTVAFGQGAEGRGTRVEMILPRI